MSKNNHNKTFSILKALGIIFIVIGHSAFHTPLVRFVYLFHIVIFFFVAGYMFNEQDLQKPFSFIKKKIVRLYFPWVVYGIIFVLLHNLFLHYHLIEFNKHTRTLIEPYNFHDIIEKSLSVLTFWGWKEVLLAPLWFLYGLFSGICVFFLISYISSKISIEKYELIRFVLITICLITGFIGPELIKHFSIIYRPLVISGLIYLGKLFKIYEDRIKLSFPVAMLCLLGLCVATYYKYDINVGAMYFGNKLIFLLISLAGCYFVLNLASIIKSRLKKTGVVLDYIGQNTLSIMVLHYMSFKLVSFVQILVYGYPLKYLAYYPVIPLRSEYWWIAYTLIGIIVPLFLSRIYEKVIFRAKGV